MDTVYKLTLESAGLRSEYFLLFLITLLIFILSGNLIGLVPYSFTFTSYFTITLSLSFTIIFTFTIISLQRNGLLFIYSFLPSGTPLLLAPLLLIIETISYIGRSISLGTRLAANLLAGHSLLHIITTNFIQPFILLNNLLILLPFLLLLSLFLMELIIAILQAYVFLLLTINYLSTALHLH